MTLPRSRMTPEQHRRMDELNELRRKGTDNATYRLTEQERMEISYLGHMNLWPKTQLGAAFNVHPSVVLTHMRSRPRIR